VTILLRALPLARDRTLARTIVTITRLKEAAATVVAALDKKAIEAAVAAAITTTAKLR
jgi:hypothetical protein